MKFSHKRFDLLVGLGACALLTIGCGSDDGSASDETGLSAPTEWLGSTPHLLAVGTIQGETVEFELEGEDAENLDRYFCERNYIVPDIEDESTYSDGYLEKIEVKWLVEVDETEREYQLELLAFDFRAAETGNTFPLVTYDEESAGDLETDSLMATFSWEYEEAGNEVEVDAPGETGSFSFERLDGTPAESNGLVVPDEEGSVGGYIEMSWDNGDEIAISFTTLCGENDLDIP